jgi:hypothetical protein
MRIFADQKLTVVLLATFICYGSIGHAQDPFPVWKDGSAANFEVVTALRSEGSSDRLIVRDDQGQNFVCRLTRSGSFSDIQELANCEPIIMRENADLQSEHNLSFIWNFLSENVPRDICGADVPYLYELAYQRFEGNRFEEEFGRWDQYLNNRLIREALEAIDGMIFVEARMREERMWVDGRMIRSEFESELDTITFILEGQRVLFDDACR